MSWFSPFSTPTCHKHVYWIIVFSSHRKIIHVWQKFGIASTISTLLQSCVSHIQWYIFVYRVLFSVLYAVLKCKCKQVWIMLTNCCLSLNTSHEFYFVWQASYIVFLGFFSYALLTGFGDEVTWVEILMYVWVFCLMLDEVREVV